MDAEMKDRWVSALRSGSYRQGRGELRTKDDRYCCLGVLCDLIDPEMWDTNEYGERHWHGSCAHLPDVVVDSLNLWDEYRHNEQTLIRMNDNDGSTFSDIADWIEENL